LRRRDLQQIDEAMHLMEQRGDERGRMSLLEQQASMEAKITRRLKQRQRVLEEMRLLKRTAPYRDLARILQCPVGTLSARVARLRERLTRAFGEDWSLGRDRL
jgi:DNA-directed RNA polymerase specialized sigma24 family protein